MTPNSGAASYINEQSLAINLQRLINEVEKALSKDIIINGQVLTHDKFLSALEELRYLDPRKHSQISISN